jgi:hypothetical protein
MRVNFSDEVVLKGKKSIFLAGPTPRGKEVASWRIEAVKKLEELGFDGVVFVPEYSTWVPKENYINQANWEREALTEATIILFWIPRSLPDMPGFSTNVEFGYWMHSKKVIYGRPDGAPKTRYLDWLYRTDYNEEPFNNLDRLLEYAVEIIDGLK